MATLVIAAPRIARTVTTLIGAVVAGSVLTRAPAVVVAGSAALGMVTLCGIALRVVTLRGIPLVTLRGIAMVGRRRSAVIADSAAAATMVAAAAANRAATAAAVVTATARAAATSSAATTASGAAASAATAWGGRGAVAAAWTWCTRCGVCRTRAHTQSGCANGTDNAGPRDKLFQFHSPSPTY